MKRNALAYVIAKCQSNSVESIKIKSYAEMHATAGMHLMAPHTILCNIFDELQRIQMTK